MSSAVGLAAQSGLATTLSKGRAGACSGCARAAAPLEAISASARQNRFHIAPPMPKR